MGVSEVQNSEQADVANKFLGIFEDGYICVHLSGTEGFEKFVVITSLVREILGEVRDDYFHIKRTRRPDERGRFAMDVTMSTGVFTAILRELIK